MIIFGSALAFGLNDPLRDLALATNAAIGGLSATAERRRQVSAEEHGGKCFFKDFAGPATICLPGTVKSTLTGRIREEGSAFCNLKGSDQDSRLFGFCVASIGGGDGAKCDKDSHCRSNHCILNGKGGVLPNGRCAKGQHGTVCTESKDCPQSMFCTRPRGGFVNPFFRTKNRSFCVDPRGGFEGEKCNTVAHCRPGLKCAEKARDSCIGCGFKPQDGEGVCVIPS